MLETPEVRMAGKEKVAVGELTPNPEEQRSLSLPCPSQAETAQEGGSGPAQETNAHPEDVIGSGM